MTARRNYIFLNNYITKAPSTNLKWFGRDSDTQFTETKYTEATDDPNHYFKNVKFVNFDIFYHNIGGCKLQKQLEDYQKISEENITNYGFTVKCDMISVAHHSERYNIFFD